MNYYRINEFFKTIKETIKVKKMADDVPKTIILSLLVLTVLISVLGTWTVMDKLNGVKVKLVNTEDTTAQGNVKFTYINPTNEAPKTIAPAVGEVTFKYEQPKEVQ
jgi:hypothetical protein